MTINDLIKGIRIDLPGEADIESLREARLEEILDDYPQDNFKYNLYTDMAILTGKTKYGESYYLKEFKYDDQYDITYTNIDVIVSDDVTGVDKLRNFNRHSRQFLIRPVLDFNGYPDLFNKLIIPRKNKEGEELKYTKINLGWAPRYVADKTTQHRLNIAYTKRFLTKTPDIYTCDSINVYGTKSLKKPFKPIEYPVYELDGRKFIRFEVYNGYTTNDSIKLSDELRYHNKEHVWIEVSQIPWIVDIERKVLIAQEGLLSGIQFVNYSKDFTPLDYSTSNIKAYLDTYMKWEILRNERLLTKEIKNKVTSKSNDKSINRITALLNDIREYQKYYLGDIDIEKKVSKLLYDYNQELEEISKNIDNETNELSIKTKNPRLLYQRLIIELEEILFELKSHGEKVKTYHDMIEILNECQKDKIDVDKDEICNDINKIKTIILEFITNENVKNKLLDELNKIIIQNINRNKAYIEEFKHNDVVRIKSLDELKKEFRRDLQPFLENKLLKTVEKQDIVNEIMTNIKIMIENHFTESKNKIVKNYLNILNDIIVEIKENGTTSDKDKLETIIELDFDLDDDINTIIRKLELMIMKAYKIKLDIEERKNKKKEIDDLKVNIDIESIFGEHTPTK